MLLTVFGMLSGNGNKRQKHNKQAGDGPLWLSFFFDYCFKTRKHCLLYSGASILACNIAAILLIPMSRDNGPGKRHQFLWLLTVARQPVIYTRFLFNPRFFTPGNLIAEKK